MTSNMADEKFILAVDHGTSGVKTSICSTQGKIVATEYECIPTYFLPQGGAEQNPDDWWNALVRTSKKLILKNHVIAEKIIAICCSSTFSSTVAVDRSGKHLMNSLTWLDSRGAPYIKRLFKGVVKIEGYNIFKILKWIRKTAGGPQLSGKDDIAHVLFIKNELPHIYEKTYMFLGSKDYLNLRLTGEFSASFDSIHLLWVTDTRNINNIHYDDDLIRDVGIDKEKLPPLKRSIDILGNIGEEFARETGLKMDVKVVVGSPDHQSACIGSGAVRDFEGHLYVGTSSWIQCIVPFKKTDPFHSIASLPTSIPGKYYCANEQDIAGGILPFLVNNFLFSKQIDPSLSPPDRIYEKLDEVASRVPPGAEKVIFAPWLNGERTPVDDPFLRGGIFNLSLRTDVSHIIRSAMEGVAFNGKWSLKYVEKFIGKRMDTLNIIGGGAKSDVWCQIFADVMNRKIKKVKDPLEANARGAAFIASVALGEISFDDIPSLVEYEKTYEPNPANREIYNELYDAFLTIYRKNKKLYRRLNIA